MMRSDKIKKCFNRAAYTYDSYSNMQKQAGKQLINAILNLQTDFSCVVDLGCGTGFTTQALLQSICYSSCVAIDFADKLIDLAKNRLSNPKISFIPGDFDKLSNALQGIDLIFSNMSMQWSENLDELILDLSKRLNHSGLIAFTVPLAGTLGELNGSSRNDYWTQDQVIKLLTKCGFLIEYASERKFVEHYDSSRMAMKSFKSTGANCLLKESDKHLHTKKYISSVYLQHDTDVTLTYQVGFYIAKKWDHHV